MFRYVQFRRLPRLVSRFTLFLLLFVLLSPASGGEDEPTRPTPEVQAALDDLVRVLDSRDRSGVSKVIERVLELEAQDAAAVLLANIVQDADRLRPQRLGEFPDMPLMLQIAFHELRYRGRSAVDPLIKLLDSKNAKQREVALDALEAIGSAAKAAVPRIAKGLRNKTHRSALREALVVHRITGRLDDAVPLLLRTLKSNEADLHLACTGLLEEPGFDPALDPVIPLLAFRVAFPGSSKDELTVLQATAQLQSGLSRMGQRGTIALIHVLNEFPQAEPQLNCLEVLEKTDTSSEELIKALQKLADHSVSEVKAVAAVTLNRLQAKAGFNEDIVLRLLNTDEEADDVSALLIVNQASKVSDVVMGQVGSRLESPSADIRQLAAVASWKHRRISVALEVLVKLAVTSNDVRISSQSVEDLWRFGSDADAVMPQLGQSLEQLTKVGRDDPNKDALIQRLLQLAMHRREAAKPVLPALKRLMVSSRPAVRLDAAMARWWIEGDASDALHEIAAHLQSTAKYAPSAGLRRLSELGAAGKPLAPTVEAIYRQNDSDSPQAAVWLDRYASPPNNRVAMMVRREMRTRLFGSTNNAVATLLADPELASDMLPKMIEVARFGSMKYRAQVALYLALIGLAKAELADILNELDTCPTAQPKAALARLCLNPEETTAQNIVRRHLFEGDKYERQSTVVAIGELGTKGQFAKEWLVSLAETPGEYSAADARNALIFLENGYNPGVADPSPPIPYCNISRIR